MSDHHGGATNVHTTNVHTTNEQPTNEQPTNGNTTNTAALGSTPLPGGGVTFAVWAPHATAVSVIGDFDGWGDGAAMDHVDGGVWQATVGAAAPGTEYRYQLDTPAGQLSRIDPRAASVTNSVGNGIVYDHGAFDWEGDDFVCPAHHELVVYELHVGSFDPDDDRSGTFGDVVSRLGHLQTLGINAIQLMPVGEFAGDLSWGYNPAHPFAVESSYGGPDALKTLVAAAHRRGIAVIIDVVYNHFGPSDLDMWQFDGWNENDKGGVYFYNDDRSATPWGDTRPDYGRAEVRSYLVDNALMWLADFHVDGLRFDMTLYMRTIDGSPGSAIDDGWSMMRELTDRIRAQFPTAITIAEDLQQLDAVTSSGDDGAGFHSQWDAGFVHPIRAVVTESDDAARSLAAVEAALAHDLGDMCRRVLYTESHDEVANGSARVPHEINPDDASGWHALKRSTLGAALVFTAPGIPMIFQGQEFVEGEWFRDDVPLDWDRRDEFSGVVRLYRDLIALRRNRRGTTRGLTGASCATLHRDDETLLLAFHRWLDGGPGDDTVVVCNFSTEPAHDVVMRFPSAGRWELALNSDASIYHRSFGNTGSAAVDATEHDGGVTATLTIGPYSALVYTKAH